MIHHLASLPWPWLVICGATAVAAAPELKRWARHEIALARRIAKIGAAQPKPDDYKRTPGGADTIPEVQR